MSVTENYSVFWVFIKILIERLDNWYQNCCLSMSEFYDLIFAVLLNVFKSFLRQGYKKEDGILYQTELSNMKRVRQFVMEVFWVP